MAKKAAKKEAKKKTAGTAAKTAGSKKKTTPAKTRAAKSKDAKRSSKSKGSISLQDIIGIRTQHVDFLSYKVDQMRKFYGDILGFTTEQRESSLNYLIVHTTSTSSIGIPGVKVGSREAPRFSRLI